jgi:hypothetical protein
MNILTLILFYSHSSDEEMSCGKVLKGRRINEWKDLKVMCWILILLNGVSFIVH